MSFWYARGLPSFPALISGEVQPPEHAVTDAKNGRASPLHCGPWIDYQRSVVRLVYPFETNISIRWDPKSGLKITGQEELIQECGGRLDVVDRFSDSYFGISCGYFIRTPKGLGTLIHGPSIMEESPRIPIESGVVDTSWYPDQLFIVHKLPKYPARVDYSRGSPMANLAFVPTDNRIRDFSVATPGEIAKLKTELVDYSALRASAEHTWEDREGQIFSHAYRHVQKKGLNQA